MKVSTHQSSASNAGIMAKEEAAGVKYPFKVKHITVNDCKIAYCDEGRSAHTIVFIHGVGSGIPVWKKNISVLKKQYRCIALDLPGHGFSDKSDFPYDMAFYSSVLISFIHSLNLEQVTLAGHSMGSQIAMHVAMQQPDLIDKIISVSPAGIEPYYPYERQLLDFGMSCIALSACSMANNRLTCLAGFNYDKALAEEFMSSLAFFKTESQAFSRMVYLSTKGMLSEPVSTILPLLKQECLIMIGSKDTVSPYTHLRAESYADMAFRITRQIPNVRAVQLKPGGHFLQYQMPDLFNKEVIRFLGKA